MLQYVIQDLTDVAIDLNYFFAYRLGFAEIHYNENAFEMFFLGWLL